MIGSSAPPKRKSYVSPMLYRIVHGSSSTSLNLVKWWKPDQEGAGLFNNATLNRSIIFKFPHFQDEQAMRAPPQAYNFDAFSTDKPIETGIYVPDNHETPGSGGYAVYLRQRNAETALRELIGLDITSNDPDDLRDRQLLELLDDLPSLDPFLVKLRFEHTGRNFPEHGVTITEDEEKAVRRLINSRLGPIVQKAFEGRMKPSEERIKELLEAIWDPRLPEAKLFLGAFGVPEEDGPEVMFAIKGVSFYEWLYESSAISTRSVLEYLAKDAVRPLDAGRYHKRERDELEKKRKVVVRTFVEHNKRGAEIFRAYDASLVRFINDGDPRDLRRFLVNARDQFWTLAHCVTAQISCHAVLNDSLATLRPAYSFDNVDITLNRLLATLNPRSGPPRTARDRGAAQKAVANSAA